MIPNTDINCSKCATPMYSDCVMWSGGDLSCLVLTKDCCDTSITDVINKLGAYICNFSNVTDYMFPFCFESYSISDFHGMQQAMLTQICVLQSEIDTLEAKVGPLDFNWGCYSSGVTSSVTSAIQRLITETCTKTSLNLTWGCITSGTTNSINDSLQAIINAESAQQISYNSSQFVVTGETGACNKGLSLKQGEWTAFDLPTAPANGWVLGTSGISPQVGGVNKMWYFKDSLGNVTVKGTFTNTGITSHYKSTGVLGTYGGGISQSQSNSFVYMTFITLPLFLAPASTSQGMIDNMSYVQNLKSAYYVSTATAPAKPISSKSVCTFPIIAAVQTTTSPAGTFFNVVNLCMWDEDTEVPMTLYFTMKYNIN